MPSCKTLLPYPLRRTAMFQMLYGGTRIRALLQRPTPVVYTKSEDQSLPSYSQEANDVNFDFSHVADRATPRNMSHFIRKQVMFIRCQDAHQRLLKQSKIKYHEPSEKLMVEAKTERLTGTSNEMKGWMPLQVLKPMGSSFTYAGKGTGLQISRMGLRQELLDGKGFGWKKKSRSLWQLDPDSKGYRPNRYY